MNEVENHTVKYFNAPKDYFWQWAEKGTVIEWLNGNTICYRDDLLAILQQLEAKGLPPLSPLLLLLAACQKTLHLQVSFFLMRQLMRLNNKELLQKTLDDALSFLQIIANLPENLKLGSKRIHLIYEVFNVVNVTISNRQLQDAIDELNSGRLDKNIFYFFSENVNEKEFEKHLQYFSNALQKYPTVEKLEIKLRTGLNELPEKAPVLIPEDVAINLFDELLQEPKTNGIARLTKNLIAALNIPMQSKGISDQPFGGISDITNRGNYDKLLLSELAYDDDLLMARLVNNEALYFRREQPPEQPKLQRIILLDSTLKMWGTSRIFALSAGLACALHNTHSELLQSYSLGGDRFTAINLNSKQGVIQALELLDHSLHCGKSLESVIKSISTSNKNEIIFITDAKILHSPVFYASFAVVKMAINFIITVNNNGDLQLFESINGITKLISTAKLDVDQLLSSPSEFIEKRKRNNNNLPLFISQQPSPLFFPAIRVKITPEKLFVKENFGLAVVNENQRLLFLNNKDKGAIELLSYIEKGDYTFGVDKNKVLNVLVNNQQRNLLKIYKFNTENFEVKSFDLSNKIQAAKKIVFKEDKFYIKADYSSFSYDCIACEIIDKKEYYGFDSFFNDPIINHMELNKIVRFSKYYEFGDSIFYRIKNLHVNDSGQLVLGKHVLTLQQNIYITLKDNFKEKSKIKSAKPIDETLYLFRNKDIKFNVWVWEDEVKL